MRQPCDTDVSWVWFLKFCRLQSEPRLLRKLSADPLCPWPHHELGELARRDGWKGRALAYDRHLELIGDAVREDSVEEEARKHAKIAGKAGALADQVLSKLLAIEERDKAGFPTISPRDAIRALESCVKIQRLVRNQATEINTAAIDTSKLTVEDMREYRRLQELLGV